MLSPELIRRIKRIHIRSGRMVDTMMAGQYRSVFRGSGIEFEEVREYSPGDEVKSIDWKVTARMGRPYVKLFREERELLLMLLVDVSGSGGFGTTEALKRDTAAEVAAVLAFNAIRNNDKIGAVLFTDAVERYVPPKKGASHVWRLVKELLSHSPERRGTDIGLATDFLAKVSRKRTVTFIISDFMDRDYIASLKRVARKHDVIAVFVSDPGDDRLPEAGILEAEDLESGRRYLLDCSDPATREAYAARRQAWRARTVEDLGRAGIDTIHLSTDASVADALRAFFRRRERRELRGRRG